jgi:hypothetical protein
VDGGGGVTFSGFGLSLAILRYYLMACELSVILITEIKADCGKHKSMNMTKRPRANRTRNSEAQLAALKKFPKPEDAPLDVGSVPIKLTMYPEALANLDLLAAEAGASKSQVVRMALAYAASNKEEFLKEFGVNPR